MRNYLLIIIITLLTGCSGSDNNKDQGDVETITGTWFSGCVESSSVPFPPAPAAFALGGYFTVAASFDNGNVIADGVMHGDSECSSTGTPIRLFEGTYTIGDTTTSMTGEQVNTMHFVGEDGLFSISWDSETHYIIENGILYMDDLLTSEIDIRRDVPYSRTKI